METLVYQQTDRLMNVVVFFSGGASSLRGMLSDPNFKQLYQVVATFTDRKDARGVNLAQQAGIPVLHLNRREFYARGNLDPRSWESRKFYYARVGEMLKEFNPDLICLSGYMHIVTDPLLGDFRYRMLNVHPADLAIATGPSVDRLYLGNLKTTDAIALVKEKQLQKKLKGENAVFDALVAGEIYTKSTVHFATEDFDEGPIFVQSKRFDVDQALVAASLESTGEALTHYANELQERMKEQGDVPAYLKALELISTNQVRVRDGGTVLVDSNELPYKGFQLEY